MYDNQINKIHHPIKGTGKTNVGSAKTKTGESQHVELQVLDKKNKPLPNGSVFFPEKPNAEKILKLKTIINSQINDLTLKISYHPHQKESAKKLGYENFGYLIPEKGLIVLKLKYNNYLQISKQIELNDFNSAIKYIDQQLKYIDEIIKNKCNTNTMGIVNSLDVPNQKIIYALAKRENPGWDNFVAKISRKIKVPDHLVEYKTHLIELNTQLKSVIPSQESQQIQTKPVNTQQNINKNNGQFQPNYFPQPQQKNPIQTTIAFDGFSEEQQKKALQDLKNKWLSKKIPN